MLSIGSAAAAAATSAVHTGLAYRPCIPTAHAEHAYRSTAHIDRAVRTNRTFRGFRTLPPQHGVFSRLVINSPGSRTVPGFAPLSVAQVMMGGRRG